MALVWVFYTSFGLANWGLIMVFQALFNKARVAAIVGTTFYLCCILPYQLSVSEGGMSKTAYSIICIFPVSAMSLTTETLLKFETSGIRIGFDNWDTQYKNWSVKEGIIML